MRYELLAYGWPSRISLLPHSLSPSVVRTVERAGPRRFGHTKTTGKRSICTEIGTGLMFEGMRDRPNLFRFFSDFNKGQPGCTAYQEKKISSTAARVDRDSRVDENR
jgi:hypothetical protein